MSRKRKIEVEESSGNIFADLKLGDSEELNTRSQIGFYVYQILKERELKQSEIAKLLGIKQPEASHLMNAHFNRFTTDKLLEFIKSLDHKVVIQISRHREGEPFQEVCHA